MAERIRNTLHKSLILVLDPRNDGFRTEREEH